MDNKLVIIGAGGHGKVVADIAKLNGYEEILFLDDDVTKTKIGKYDVAGTLNDADKYTNDYDFFVAIGNNKFRKEITNILENKDIVTISMIHPSAVIDKTVNIGKGTVVMANTVINADTKIGDGCIINTAATVDHDCVIEDFVHISPGTHIAGTVNIGENTWIGVGSSIVNNIFICSNCIIGAGSVVITDIKKEGTYLGCPAKIKVI